MAFCRGESGGRFYGLGDLARMAPGTKIRVATLDNFPNSRANSGSRCDPVEADPTIQGHQDGFSEFGV